MSEDPEGSGIGDSDVSCDMSKPMGPTGTP